MAKGGAEIRATSSHPPHVRAQRHLTRFVERLTQIARSQARGRFSGSLEEWHHYEEDGLYPSPGRARMADTEDFNYEADLDPSDDLLEITQLRKDAQFHIDQGSADDFLAVVHQLLDYVNNRSVDFGEVDRWIDFLESPGPSVERVVSSDERERIFDVVSSAVRRLSVELIRLIAEDRRALDLIEWRQLELVVATALEGLGFEVEVTPPAKDGGKDVIATCTLNGQRKRYYLELKHWRSGKQPGIKYITDFVQVNVEDRTDGGVFLSTSGYAMGKVRSCFTELRRANIDLGDARKITYYCSQYVKAENGLWNPTSNLASLLFVNSAMGAGQTGPRRGP